MARCLYLDENGICMVGGSVQPEGCSDDGRCEVYRADCPEAECSSYEFTGDDGYEFEDMDVDEYDPNDKDINEFNEEDEGDDEESEQIRKVS